MKNYIKNLIKINKDASKNIDDLEIAVSRFTVKNDKDKANFGNLCIALKGYRMIADASEAILLNDDVVKGDDNEFYAKVSDEELVVPHVDSKLPGGDFVRDQELNTTQK